MDQKTIDRICAELTNKEKAVITSEAWKRDKTPNPLKKYGIRKIVTADSAKEGDYWLKDEKERAEGEYQCVTYPSAAALGAGWNYDNAALVGNQIGRSCKLHGVDIVFRPGMNIKRSPLCGRNFEYFSEDPVLSGKLAAAFVKGVQEQGVSACPKHYACNNQEFERMTTNAIVSERALREIYLRAFQIVIEEGKPWSLMTSYNRVNGEYVNENRHLMEILRKEFGFDGYVTSDGAAVQTGHSAASHENGMDYELGDSHEAEVQDALDSGKLSERAINDNIRHLLEVYDKINAGECHGEEDQEAEHLLARKIAADGLVLLINNGVLPLQTDRKVAVIGAMAEKPAFMGTGSGFSNAYHLENALEEITKIIGKAPAYAPAYELAASPEEERDGADTLIEEAVKAAEGAETVLFFTGLPYGYEGEGVDRGTLKLPKDQTEALDAVMKAGNEVVIINNSGAPVDLSAYQNAAAVLHAYPAGEGIGGAIADVLYGREEPGGRLPETFPVKLQDTPAFLNYVTYPQVRDNVLYGEDVFVGYRWYDTREIAPLFCFGHGLSYTEFSYGQMTVDGSEITPDDRLQVSMEIRNIGKRSGSQVLQLYVHPCSSGVVRPYKELKAFTKVFLEAGESKKITMELNRQAFEYYSEEQHKWIAESGNYQLLLGISSQEIVAAMEVKLVSKERAMVYHRYTAAQRLLKDSRAQEIAKELEGEKRRFLVPDKEKDAILDSPFAYAVPIYHAMEDDSIMVAGERLTESEFSMIVDRLNHD